MEASNAMDQGTADKAQVTVGRIKWHIDEIYDVCSSPYRNVPGNLTPGEADTLSVVPTSHTRNSCARNPPLYLLREEK